MRLQGSKLSLEKLHNVNMSSQYFTHFSGHINMISSCDFSPDERWVCTGSWDKSILIWDVNAGTYRYLQTYEI